MLNVIEEIRANNAGRDPERLAMKYQNMRGSPFVFLRGTCHLFYDRLPKTRAVRKSPLVWVCGDLHIENFGSYKGDNRLAYFDINDFDEATLAPASWDLVRLITSVLVAAQTLHQSRAQALQFSKGFLQAYADALALGKARWLERETAQGLIQQLLSTLEHRTRVDFLDKRTTRKRNRRILNCADGHALPVDDEQRARAIDLIDEYASEQAHPEFFKVLDVARRIAGTGSLGVERYVILVEGKGSPNGNYLLDLKQAMPASIDTRLKLDRPDWPSQAHRVVALQRRTQAVSMAFLHPIAKRKKSYILRGLQAMEDRVNLDAHHQDPQRIQATLADMGRVVAWAHLRASGRQGSGIADDLIAYGENRKKWLNDMLEVGEACAEQVTADWQCFVQALAQGGIVS